MEEEGKQTEETQETQQEQKQEGREQKYEVKILRQISYLPTVFMLKTKWGQVIKISLINSDYVDCGKYESNSGLTFSGCFNYNNGELKETRGIYYTPIVPLFSVSYRGKMTRNLNEMKEIVKFFIENVYLVKNSIGKKYLVSYDNYSISLFDRFRKADLLQFDQVAEQGHLEIFEVPLPKHVKYLEFEDTNEINIYNHVIKTNVNIKVYRLYSNPGLAYLIYIPEYVVARISSQDHEERLIDLYSGRYYLIAHPAPIHKVD